MSRRTYSIKESVNRLYRIFSGQAPPEDTPESLAGSVFSEDEALSYLVETLGGSMPDVTGTIPTGLQPINTPDNYISGKKSGVYAYLATGTATTIASGSYGTWYPIAGPFVNNPFEDFTIAADQIAFDGTRGFWFEIDWHASVDMDAGNNIIQIGISKNGTVLQSSVMRTYVATLTLQMSGTVVTWLDPADTIQLVMSAQDDGEDINVLNFTTTIHPFF